MSRILLQKKYRAYGGGGGGDGVVVMMDRRKGPDGTSVSPSPPPHLNLNPYHRQPLHPTPTHQNRDHHRLKLLVFLPHNGKSNLDGVA